MSVGLMHLTEDCKPENALARGAGRVAPLRGSAAGTAGEGGAAALPCLGSHNSNEAIGRFSPEGVLNLGTHAGLVDFCRATESALTSSQKRSLFALRENLEEHISTVGVNHMAFVTVTSKARHSTAKDFQEKVFHVLTTSPTFKRHFGRWYRVFEPHKSGDWHVHLLAETHSDILSGVDVSKLRAAIATGTKDRAKTARLYREFAPADHPIRAIWRDLRRLTSVSKGIGRIQVEPIRSNAEGVGKYLSKYLQKGVLYRKAWSNGEKVRFWGKSKDAPRRVSCQFAWNSPKATMWRGKLAMVAEHFRVSDFGGFSRRWGSRWAYWLGPCIREIDSDYPLVSPANDAARRMLHSAAWGLESRRGMPIDLDSWRLVWAAEETAKSNSEENQRRFSELVASGWTLSPPAHRAGPTPPDTPQITESAE